MIPAIVDHIEEVRPGVISLYFMPDRPVHYIAGQFIELHLPHNNDDRGQHRWFTLSSAPHEPLLAITTRLNDTMPSTFKRALTGLKKGDRIQFAPPLGDFVLPKLSTIPLTLVACGIGVTPFRSIIEDSVQRREERDLRLIYADNNHLFSSTFSLLENAYHPIQRSDLSPQAIIDLGAVSSDHYIYIAGPEEVVEQLVDGLVRLNIERSQIYTDFFHGYK